MQIQKLIEKAREIDDIRYELSKLDIDISNAEKHLSQASKEIKNLIIDNKKEPSISDQTENR